MLFCDNFWINQVVTFVCPESQTIKCLISSLHPFHTPINCWSIDCANKQSIDWLVHKSIHRSGHWIDPVWEPPHLPWNINQLNPLIVTPSNVVPSINLLIHLLWLHPFIHRLWCPPCIHPKNLWRPPWNHQLLCPGSIRKIYDDPLINWLLYVSFNSLLVFIVLLFLLQLLFCSLLICLLY